MKNRFTEEQIIGVLKEGEAGAKIADLCRKRGISDATYYKLEGEILRYDCLRCPAPEGIVGRERQAQALAGRVASG